MPRTHQEKLAGFTILELSIVIVIIALLAASITMGSVMIRQAELRSVISDVDRIKKSIQSFQDKFLALPGDFSGATSFWGADARGCPATSSPTTVTKATCNGNGNGVVGAWNTWTGEEHFRLWQHLSNAELFEGVYSGTGDTATPYAVLGQNVPKSRAKGVGYSVVYYAPTVEADYFVISTPQHAIYIGRPYTNRLTENGAFSSTEAAEIEAKIDDGVPYTGNLMSHREGTYNVGCVADGATPAGYLTTNTNSPTCGLIFLLGL